MSVFVVRYSLCNFFYRWYNGVFFFLCACLLADVVKLPSKVILKVLNFLILLHFLANLLKSFSGVSFFYIYLFPKVINGLVLNDIR